MTEQQQLDAFGNPVPAPEPGVPNALLLSRKLWIISAVAGFVQAFVQLADRRSLVEVQHVLQPGLDQDQIDASVNGTILFALVSSVATVVVYVMLANRMVQGRNWARIVLLVFGVITVLMTLLNLLAVGVLGNELIQRLVGRTIPVWGLIAGAVIAVMHAGASVVMFRPGTNQYFRGMRNPRPQAGSAG